MFESLSNRLSSTIQKLRGRARLTEENIREAMRDVRIALLEADVALPVVSALIESIKQRAVGQDVLKSLSPGQALVKVVQQELTAVMGSQNSELNLNVPAPAVVLLANNVPSFALYVTLEDVKDRQALVAQLASLLSPDQDVIQKKLWTGKGGKLQPRKFRDRLTLREATLIESHRLDLPGVMIQVESQRNYPAGGVAAHLLGYVGGSVC